MAARPASRARVAIAEASDAAGLAELYNAVADGLTREHGRGHWSTRTTERGVLGRRRSPRFTPVGRALYLTGLAVDPAAQGRGLGRRMVAAAIEEARKWPADAVRLDAYDTPAGAGALYVSCGFRERGRVTYKGTPLRYFEMLLS